MLMGSRVGVRWGTAIHEASHAVVARRLGGEVRYVVLLNDESGDIDARTWGRTQEEAGVNSAVWLLAGAEGGQRVGHDGDCSFDLDGARRYLRGTSVSLNEARSQARLMVAQNWGEVQRCARRLYDRPDGRGIGRW